MAKSSRPLYTVNSRRGGDKDWRRITIDAKIVQPSTDPDHCVEVQIEESGREMRTSYRVLYLTKPEAVTLGEHLVELGSQA